MKAFDPSAPAREGSGIFGLPHAPDEAGVVLVPVPWEATTSYGHGAAGGPAAILRASRQVDLYDVETGRPYEAGIALLPEAARVRAWNREARRAAAPVIAAGGEVEGRPALQKALARVNALSAKLNDWVEGQVGPWLDRGKLVGVVGGDHSVSLGALRAAGARHPGLGVLHVDAHADLRPAYEGFTWSHASILYNVLEEVAGVGRLVQVGIRDLGDVEVAELARRGRRVVAHYDAELAALRFAGETWAAQCDRIVADLPSEVWITFDVDGLDPALCPHTGTPVPGGLSFAQASYLLGAVARAGRRVIGFDLTEVAPGPRGDEWDANVGARLLYKLVGWALRSRAAS